MAGEEDRDRLESGYIRLDGVLLKPQCLILDGDVFRDVA